MCGRCCRPLALILLLAVLVALAFAAGPGVEDCGADPTCYYVSPDGDNDNPGTLQDPWADPGYATRQMEGGDTLVLLDGEYSVSVYDVDILTPPSGTSEQWTVIRGEDGKRPTIKGSGNLIWAIDLSGCDYVRVEDLEITSDSGADFREGVSATGAPLSHAVLDDLYIHHVDEFGIDMADVEDLEITDCDIEYCGFGAVGGPEGQSGGWRDVTISGCSLSYGGHYYAGGPGPGPYERPDGFGIEPSSGPIEIKNTVAQHNRGDGLDSKADNTCIHNCVVANNSCDGVKLWGDGSRVENTLIYGTGDGVGGASPWAGLVLDDYDTPGADFEIVNVTIHDNPTRQAYSLYMQYDTNNPIDVLFRNNIVSNAYGLAYFGDSVNLTADHNLFHRPGGGGQVYANGREYTAAQLQAGELGEQNLSTDPLFVSPQWGSDGDYHLQQNSPARDSGSSTGAPTVDLEGSTRPMGNGYDMGAYEYSDSPLAPVVNSVDPAGASNDGEVTVNVSGSGFQQGVVLTLENGGSTITGTTTGTVLSSGFTSELDLTGAQEGFRDVVVTNPDTLSGTLADGFEITVADAPVVDPPDDPDDDDDPKPRPPASEEDPLSTWYLPEGSTAWGYSCYVTVANPNTTSVTAGVTYNTTSGAVDGGTLSLPARSQTTINPAETLGEEDFSTLVECSQGKRIAVDRTMYWPPRLNSGALSPAPGVGILRNTAAVLHHARSASGETGDAHCSVGVNSPAKTWYLPEGSSAWGFECWHLVQNPNDAEAHITLTYMIEGASPEVRTRTVPADSRATYNMADEIGRKDASVKVESDIPVIPERAMYRNNRREGHDSIGTTTPATSYYLAEGTTAWGFTTYLLVQNPQTTQTSVNVTYLTSSGEVLHPENPVVMPANSRKTIRVNDVLPDKDFSTKVTGTEPIIAERAMYFGEDTAAGESCHDSIGLTTPSTAFYFPDGQTSEGRETWTLVANPNSEDVEVRVTYLTPDGLDNPTFTDTVPANSRKSYSMADAGIQGRAAVMVECLTPGAKIAAERAIYWDSRSAATNSIGAFSD